MLAECMIVTISRNFIQAHSIGPAALGRRELQRVHNWKTNLSDHILYYDANMSFTALNSHTSTHTSDFSENCRCEMASGAIHLSGNLLVFFVDWYISSASLERPKSVTFSNLLQLTRTFLQAKSRWMMLMLDRNACRGKMDIRQWYRIDKSC